MDALKADEFVFKVLKNTPEKNLEHIIGLCTSRNEWEDLCKDVDVRYILGVAEENFLYAVSMYDLNRVENFRRFIQDYHKVSILLSTISAENLRYIVSLYGATNRDQLDQLCKYLDVGEF